MDGGRDRTSFTGEQSPATLSDCAWVGLDCPLDELFPLCHGFEGPARVCVTVCIVHAPRAQAVPRTSHSSRKRGPR